MGFFSDVKKGLKKVAGTVADVAQVAAPVIDVFAPGVGMQVGQVAQGIDRLGIGESAVSELNKAGNVVSGVYNTITGAGGIGGVPGISTLPFLTPDLGREADRIYDTGVGAANSIRIDAIKGLEEQQYQQALANHAAAQQNAAARASVANANNAARASAARQTEANRQRALRKANRQRKKFFGQATDEIRPYANAGLEVLPYHTNAAANANTLGNALMGKLMGGLPRRGLTTPGLVPLPYNMQGVSDGAISQLNPVQVVAQQPASVAEVVQETPTQTQVSIPQDFSDIELTQRQKKRLKRMNKQERKIAKQHMLAKAQEAAGGREVTRTLRQKFDRRA